MLHFIYFLTPRRPIAGWILSFLVLCLPYGCSDKKITTDQTAGGMGGTEASPESMNKLTSQEKSDGWVLMFDGKNMHAWRGYNQTTFPSNGWVVKDGVLMMEATGKEQEGYGGDIITKDQFENFEFKMDFKVSPDANGGILYLVKEEPDKPIWHNAAEYQLLDNDGFEKKNKYQMDKHRTGDNFDMQSKFSPNFFNLNNLIYLCYTSFIF